MHLGSRWGQKATITGSPNQAEKGQWVYTCIPLPGSPLSHRVVMESAGRPRAGHLMSLCISFFFCSKRTDNSQPSEDSAEMSAASPAQPGVGRGFSKCLVRCAHSHWSAVLTRAAGVGRVRAAAGTAPAPSSRKSRAWGSGHELQSPTPLSPST